jgi:PhnB protein
MIVLNQEAPEQGILSPLSTGVSGSQIHLYVDDVDASWNRAVEAGAQIRNPLFDAYWGDRTGLLADNDGHIWSIASKIENVSKEEIIKRSKAGLICDNASDESEVDVSAKAEVPYVVETVAAQGEFVVI